MSGYLIAAPLLDYGRHLVLLRNVTEYCREKNVTAEKLQLAAENYFV
jgi:hypothetical protein